MEKKKKVLLLTKERQSYLEQGPLLPLPGRMAAPPSSWSTTLFSVLGDIPSREQQLQSSSGVKGQFPVYTVTLYCKTQTILGFLAIVSGQ